MKSTTPLLFLAALAMGGWAVAQSVAEDQAALVKAKAMSREAVARASALEAQAASQTDAAQAYQSRSAAIAARIQSAEADIEAAEARVRLIEQMQAKQRQVLAEKQEPAVRLIAALQMMARRPPSIALVQPTSTRDIVHVRAALDSMVPILRQRTAGLRSDLAHARQLRADASKAVEALGAGRNRLAAQRASLDTLAEQHRAQARRIAGSAMAEQDRAIAMSEKARDLSALIENVAAQAGTRAELEALPGPVLRPAQPGLARAEPLAAGPVAPGLQSYRLPVIGQVVAGLGEVTEGGRRESGMTIATRPMAQIVAPAPGRVAFAGAYRSFGRIVIIDHGRGWTTLITNMAATNVAVGDELVAGSPVGRAGPERPRITVELRNGPAPVDISRYLG